MKRKIAWLALPLVLFALIFGVIWRRNHPTPTKEDLEIRALIVRTPLVLISPYSQNGVFNKYEHILSITESMPFADSFYISQSPIKRGARETLFVEFILLDSRPTTLEDVLVRLNVNQGEGTVVFISNMGDQTERNLHPVTFKRWMELLLTNPQIGPELRKRMNP